MAWAGEPCVSPRPPHSRAGPERTSNTARPARFLCACQGTRLPCADPQTWPDPETPGKDVAGTTPHTNFSRPGVGLDPDRLPDLGKSPQDELQRKGREGTPLCTQPAQGSRET